MSRELLPPAKIIWERASTSQPWETFYVQPGDVALVLSSVDPGRVRIKVLKVAQADLINPGKNRIVPFDPAVNNYLQAFLLMASPHGEDLRRRALELIRGT